MARFALLAALVVVCCVSSSLAVFPDLLGDPFTVQPSYASVFGKEIIQITGGGFASFQYAQCVWGDEWESASTNILSDTLIECETPVISATDLATYGVPFFTSLKIVFNGDTLFTSYVLPTDSFRFGMFSPALAPRSVPAVPVAWFAVACTFVPPFLCLRSFVNSRTRARLASSSSSTWMHRSICDESHSGELHHVGRRQHHPHWHGVQRMGFGRPH